MATDKKTKTAKNYLFMGLGFPIVFPIVELTWMVGEWLPNVNMKTLTKKAFEALIDYPACLTGSQVAFIRGFMNMHQEEFAKSLGLSSHSQISRWEKHRQNNAGLSPSHEANLRVLMKGFLGQENLLIKEHIRVLSGALIEPKGPIRLKAS